MWNYTYIDIVNNTYLDIVNYTYVDIVNHTYIDIVNYTYIAHYIYPRMVNYSLLGPSFKFPHLRYDELIGNGTISKEMQELDNQGHSWKYRDQNYTKHFLLS